MKYINGLTQKATHNADRCLCPVSAALWAVEGN
jgi:hypothetical protein